MPARIVVVHDGPCLERMISGLSQRGHDVRGYSDPLAALSALEDARRVEVLLTRLHFGPGKSNGVALETLEDLEAEFDAICDEMDDDQRLVGLIGD